MRKIVILIILLFPMFPLWAEETSNTQQKAEEMAVKLNDPLVSIYMVPFQFNYDHDIGYKGDGEAYSLKIQPVIPFNLKNTSFNIVSRTIVPIIWERDAVYPGSDKNMLGDISESLFITPKHEKGKGFLFGYGLIFRLPTATDDLVASKQFAIGPTVSIVYKINKTFMGFLVSQSWKVAGWNDGNDVNEFSFQPFISHTIKTFSGSLELEYNYDWNRKKGILPLNISVSNLFMLGGKVPMQARLGYRCYIQEPDFTNLNNFSGSDWGLRFSLTFVL